MNALMDDTSAISHHSVAKSLSIAERGNPSSLGAQFGDLFNGCNVLETSWANFPFYLDFGPDVGVVDYVRVPVAEGLDGLLLPLPRKRTPADQEERKEILIGLRGRRRGRS